MLTDIAPAMVQISQQRFINKPKVKVICMDGERLTLPSQFDLITSSMTLHWFSELEESFEGEDFVI